MQPPDSSTSTSKRPPFSLAATISAIHSEIRWKMLAALARGESLMVNELAAEARCTPNAASRHLAELKKKGIVTNKRRLYQLSDKLERVAPGQIDFGYFVARFDTK
jgi:predicted transcriptional regulator